MTEKTKELLDLIKANPDLPVIPMVDYEVVCDDCCTYWMGSWGNAKVDEYYIRNERVHFNEIECKYIPYSGETFIELFEQENDGWWCDVWEYPVYVYTPDQKQIVKVFKENIQPKIKEILKDGKE